jgi:hypothetical protein
MSNIKTRYRPEEYCLGRLSYIQKKLKKSKTSKTIHRKAQLWIR